MLSKAALVATAAVAVAFGQTHERVTSGQTTHERIVVNGPGIPGHIGVAGTIAHSEFGGPVVKNAPYQAEAVTETVQVLADGNRIVRRNSSTVARDSEGRTRRDISIGGSPKITVIHDPVANVSYTLEHESKTARKMQGRGMVLQYRSRGHAGSDSAHAPEDILLEGGPMSFNVRLRSGDRGKTESLGKQTIEGIVAEGTRVTDTIPAGEIGNERPIEIVFERWYSPELQTLVSSTHKDPMVGQTTYKLANLNRSEPLKSSFEIPAGYTVKEASEPAVKIMRRKVEKE